MPISTARTIAFEVLACVESEAAYAADALHARLEVPRKPACTGNRATGSFRPGVRREDAALATELTMGVLRWQRLLDFLIERQAGRPSAELDPGVRVALRLGAYQLLFLDRVPPSAAVNDSVELTKRARKRSAASLVNAVLRHLPRGPARVEDFASLLPPGLPVAERLGILFSHPTWIVERWLLQFGADRTRALLAADNLPLPVACAVLDPQRRQEVDKLLREEGLEVAPGRLLRSALLVSRGNPLITRAYRGGLFVVQDEASQAIPLLAAVEPGDSVLDVCAAPGNKTLPLTRAAGPGSLIIAADIHHHRLRALRAQLRRARIGGVELLALDATRPLPFARSFRRILVDAPCSGTGTLARNPEIRWRVTPRDIDELSFRQTAIFTRAVDCLAPGGRLVYATCSLEPEENEQVIRRVLALPGAEDVQLVPPPPGFAANLAPGVATDALFDGEGFFRTLPPETSTDGFFAAILERR